MSFLTEVSSSGSSSATGNSNLDYNSSPTNPSSGAGGGSANDSGASSSYDYHLPHTKTIDLIGEEFAPRKDSPTITTGSSIAIVTSSGGLPVSSTLFLNSNNILTTLAPLSGCSSSTSSLLQAISAGGGQVVTLPPNMSSLTTPVVTNNVVGGANSPAHELLNSGSSPGAVSTIGGDVSTSSSTVITTLPFNPSAVGQTQVLSDVISQPITSSSSNVAHGNPEENGVLLCNLDELSRYIPETFYSDFNIAEPTKLDYLDGSKQPQHIQQSPSLTTVSALGSSSVMVSSGSPILSSTSSVAATPISAALSNTLQPFQTASTVATAGATTTGTPITIQLPTQPQPPQGVKTLTYVQNNTAGNTKQNTGIVSNAGGLQPVKLTTGFAYTATGEKFSIQGLTDHSKSSTVQVQVKPQTLQLAGLDPSKLAVLQELPDVSKVVIQEQPKTLQGSSITNLLEDIKAGGPTTATAEVEDGGVSTVGYTTAIPVAVSTINGTPIKKSSGVGTAATVLMPNKRSRNIIFAGNSLPQGAIPIQINGLNALPISAVKSIPLSIGSLAAPLQSSPPHVVRKAATKLTASQLLTNNNNVVVAAAQNTATKQQVLTAGTNTIKCPIITSSGATNIYSNTVTSASVVTNSSSSSTSSTKAIGNNKTCTWVFENGEVCGKTFSKSYNLVVHMRMHEDVRPFCCSLCDQTFRQKAHLQRHETTHGIGVKVARNSSNLKKRKKSKNALNTAATTTTTTQIVLPSPTPSNISSNLQKRLSRVDEKFGIKTSNSNNNNNTKFSSHDIDEAIKAAVEGSSLGVGGATTVAANTVTAPLLSLKREPPDVADESGHHHISKIPHMSVKVEPDDDNHNKSTSSHMNSNSQAVGPPITAQFVQNPGSTTIVIDNLEDHSPEIQKEILNALLADHGTGLFTIQQATAPSAVSNDVIVDTGKVEDHHLESSGGDGSNSNSSAANTTTNSSQSFPPVTVQEFLQESTNSSGGGHHILVENSSAD